MAKLLSDTAIRIAEQSRQSSAWHRENTKDEILMMANPDALQGIIDKMRPVLDLPNGGARVKRSKRGQAKRRPDREDTVYIAGHFPRDTIKRLKIIAAQEGKTMHELIAEALTVLLADRDTNSVS